MDDCHMGKVYLYLTRTCEGGKTRLKKNPWNWMNSMDLSQKGPWNAEKTNPWPSMKKNTQRKISSDDSWNCSTSASWNLTKIAPEIRAFCPKKDGRKSLPKPPFFRVHFLLFLDPQGYSENILTEFEPSKLQETAPNNRMLSSCMQGKASSLQVSGGHPGQQKGNPMLEIGGCRMIPRCYSHGIMIYDLSHILYIYMYIVTTYIYSRVCNL